MFATLLQTSYFRLAEATILQHSFQADTGHLYDVLALDWRPKFLCTSMWSSWSRFFWVDFGSNSQIDEIE